MFVKNDQLIELLIHYRKKGHTYVAHTNSEMKNLDLSDENQKKYDVLNVKMSNLTWGLYNQLQEDALMDRGDGAKVFNYKRYKENKLIKLIKEWDAREGDKGVPVNPQTVTSLVPSIAEAILRAYDEVTFIGEEDEKK